MNWESFGLIEGIISSLGVVLSLVYLATQIRAQNRESRISSIHDINESFRNAISSFQDPVLADLFARAKDDFESLTETERLQFISMMQGVLRVWEDAFHQHKEKRLPEHIWKAMVIQFSGYLSLTGVQKVWALRKKAYSKDFRLFVDSTRALEYKSL